MQCFYYDTRRSSWAADIPSAKGKNGSKEREGGVRAQRHNLDKVRGRKKWEGREQKVKEGGSVHAKDPERQKGVEGAGRAAHPWRI